MKRLLLVGTFVLAFAASAHAGCSTSSLAGSWRIITQDSVCSATISSSGKFSNIPCSDGSHHSGSLSLTSGCQLGGSIDGFAIAGRTNPLSSSSTAKPTIMLGANANGKIAFNAFRL
jgi:hypothetical protein